jgi:hypothetical protein
MAMRVITVLRKEGVILGAFTNNLAAFQQLKASIPDHEADLLPSYSTVNRVVREAGNSKAFSTSAGQFIIQKLNLYKTRFT